MKAFHAFLFFALMAAPALAQDAPPAPEAPPAEEIMPAGEDVPIFEELVPPSPAPIRVPPMEEEKSAKPFNAVKLRGLNKVTARISTLEAPLGAIARFGNIEIIARKCWQAPPEDQPENAALLQIRELKPGEGPKEIFSGWMFASSPALSALEHPVYDVTVISCITLEDQ